MYRADPVSSAVVLDVQKVVAGENLHKNVTEVVGLWLGARLREKLLGPNALASLFVFGIHGGGARYWRRRAVWHRVGLDFGGEGFGLCRRMGAAAPPSLDASCDAGCSFVLHHRSRPTLPPPPRPSLPARSLEQIHSFTSTMNPTGAPIPAWWLPLDPTNVASPVINNASVEKLMRDSADAAKALQTRVLDIHETIKAQKEGGQPIDPRTAEWFLLCHLLRLQLDRQRHNCTKLVEYILRLHATLAAGGAPVVLEPLPEEMASYVGIAAYLPPAIRNH
ncbi:hypothetical protein VTO73DRAFT_7168 [Trametes versicolor]